MEPIYLSIRQKETGNQIKRLLKENGYTVKDVQNAMGFENPQAIYKWMAGRSLPSLDNLIILSRILHISMEDILVVDGDVVFYRVLNQGYNDRNIAGHYDVFRRIIRELHSYGRKLLEDEGLFTIYGSVCIC